MEGMPPFVNQETIERLKLEIALDAKRLSEAANKAGVTWAGCDTADMMAEEILVLRHDLDTCREYQGDTIAANALLRNKNEQLKSDLALAKRVGLALMKVLKPFAEEGPWIRASNDYYLRPVARALSEAIGEFPNLLDVLKSL